MKDIAIYGAGGLGREVAAVLPRLTYCNPEGWNLIGFFDDGCKSGDQIGNFGTILGGINELNNWPEQIGIALAFGEPATIKAVRNKITNPLISFPNLINQNFDVTDPDTLSIGEGNIIQGNCIATTSVHIGNFNLLNASITLGHDVTVGDYNVFMPGCRISGEANIGSGCLFGAMSFVKQQLTVPDGVRLSPLSALLTKPKPNSTYIGNPAKRMCF